MSQQKLEKNVSKLLSQLSLDENFGRFHMNLGQRKYTIIELLVTISTIAILSSMLLPALSQAKNKTKAIHCMSNLKQISTASILYADDFNGFIPKQVADAGSYQLGTNLYIEASFITRKTLLCPSETVSLEQALTQDNGKQIFYYTYGIYRFPASDTTFNVVHYSSTTGNTEGYYPHKAKFTSQFTLYADSGFSPVRRTFWYFERYAKLRLAHLHKANIAFLDGHVEAKGQELKKEPNNFTGFVTSDWQTL
jgi:prepilin-type processing-associated H-X9-DG protein